LSQLLPRGSLLVQDFFKDTARKNLSEKIILAVLKHIQNNKIQELNVGET
jgi:hypothetical protein